MTDDELAVQKAIEQLPTIEARAEATIEEATSVLLLCRALRLAKVQAVEPKYICDLYRQRVATLTGRPCAREDAP